MHYILFTAAVTEYWWRFSALQISESGVEEGDVTNINDEQGVNQDEQVFGENANAEGDDEVGGEVDAVEDSEGLCLASSSAILLGNRPCSGAIYQLTHNPLPDDVLLYAIPMVGPYQVRSFNTIRTLCLLSARCSSVLVSNEYIFKVFGNFKYKAKITPGTSRKGKAGKAAFDLFLVSFLFGSL